MPWEPQSKTIFDLVQLAERAEASMIAVDARALAERVAEGRFYVACVGQFKRGKSTLLNALVGRAVLPVGVAPVTSAVTILRYGDRPTARVRFVAGHAQQIDPAAIAEYVAEDANPENQKGVAAVEVFVPSTLLASGICLVDTPGIGSVFAGNTAVTRAFVPHIDAAIVVVGADPPLSGEELSLIDDVAKQVRDLIVVLNKADRLSEAERREGIAFADKTLARRLGRALPAILEVSATERLAGASTRDWDRLETALRILANRSGAQLVQAAEMRGRELLIARLVHELDEQRSVLTRPIDESARRVDGLKRTVADAESTLRELGYRLAAEQDRLYKLLAENGAAFVARAVPTAREELTAAIDKESLHRPALRRRAIEIAQEIVERLIGPLLREEQARAEKLYADSMRRFVGLANEFLDRVRQSGAEMARVSPLGEEAELTARSRFFKTELLAVAPLSAGAWIVDRLRTAAGVRRAIERDAARYLERLLTANSARVENDLKERVLESRRRLETDLRARLREIYASAERALERARWRYTHGAESVKTEIARLEALKAEAEALR